MGCGASKAAEVTPTALPTGNPTREFTPETKPSSTTPAEKQQIEEQGNRSQGARDVAKRVDDIVSQTSPFDEKDVEDTAETAEKDEAPAGPLQVAAVPVLPPPPMTPPTVLKPIYAKITDNGYQQADSLTSVQPLDEEEDDTSYFPQQVSLRVPGPGAPAAPAPQQGGVLPPAAPPSAPPSPPQQLQLQPAFSTRMQAPDTSTSFTSPQFSSLPSLGLQQQPAYEKQASQQRLQPAQSQREQQASEPDPNDPWSSLQSVYRIKNAAPEASGRPAAGTSSMSSAQSGRRGGPLDPAAGKEVLVLGDDDDFGGRAAPRLAEARSQKYPTSGLPPLKPLAQPKQGGWGAGQMAQAGELMLGDDDWLEGGEEPGDAAGAQRRPPPAAQPSAGAGSVARGPVDEEDEDVMAHVPLAKGRVADDVMCEDIEDVDALLEDEMQNQGLSNKNLASKLAAFDAQFNED